MTGATRALTILATGPLTTVQDAGRIGQGSIGVGRSGACDRASYRLANRLQVIRDLVQRPVRVTSGYRTPEHNKAVGGSKNSLHLSGMAADIVIPGLSARDVQLILLNWSGGMGCYAGFTHLDTRANRARWGEHRPPRPAGL